MEDQTNTIEQEVVEQPQVEEQVVEQPVETAEPQQAPFQIYNSAEELAQAQMAAVQEEPTPTPQVEEAPMEEAQETPVQPEPRAPQYSEDQVDQAVTRYLSEKLGREITTLDDLTQPQVQIDERVQAIAKFVEETGRNPQDWFTYQSLNASEMDDMTAVRVQLATDHPNLTIDEVNMLMGSKYKLDPERFTQEEVQLSQLQLKMDAANAKSQIEKMRDSYAAPAPVQEEVEEIVNDQWIADMRREVSQLSGIEFDLGNDKSFTFGIDDQYRNELMDKNARLDEFFDPYVRENGTWDYDKLSSHRTVIDNIDKIVRSAYQQGMSDGQRNVVSKAANVQASAPVEQGPVQQNSLGQQLRGILRANSSKMTFNA